MHIKPSSQIGPAIPTTSRTVAKLKKAARQRVRRLEGTHASALDFVAKEAGYMHWKHVLECEDATVAQGIPFEADRYLAAMLPPLDAMQLLNSVTYTLITGPSGIGKTVLAVAAGRQILAAGGTVLYLEGKQGYAQLIAAKPDSLKGTVVPGIGDGGAIGTGRPNLGLLIIDELYQFQAEVLIDGGKALGFTPEAFLEVLLNSGVSVLLVSQDSPESPQLAPFLKLQVSQSVRVLKIRL